MTIALIQYPLDSDETITFELEIPNTWVPANRVDDFIKKATTNFRDALKLVDQVKNEFLNDARKMEMQEIEVEFGIKASFNSGFVIASGATEAHFLIKLKWVRDDNKSNVKK